MSYANGVPPGYSPSQPGGGGYPPSQPGGGGYAPSQQGGGGYAPSQQGGGGYAPSQPGGFAPSQHGGYATSQTGQYPPQQMNGNMGGGGGGGGGAGVWLVSHNPFKKANELGPDIQWAARYKQSMGVCIVDMIVAFFALVLNNVFSINFLPFLHVIPILMPCCSRGASPFYWSLISVGSIIASIVSIFLGIIDSNGANAAIAGGVIIMIELVNLFILSQMDNQLKEKIKGCFAECGCCGKEAQMQTMYPESRMPQQQNQMNRQMNQQYPQGQGQGFAPGSQPGGYAGEGNYQSNPGGSGYFPPAPPSQVGESYGHQYTNTYPQGQNPHPEQQFHYNYSQQAYGQPQKPPKRKSAPYQLHYQPQKAPTQPPIHTATNYRPGVMGDNASDATGVSGYSVRTPNPIMANARGPPIPGNKPVLRKNKAENATPASYSSAATSFFTDLFKGGQKDHGNDTMRTQKRASRKVHQYPQHPDQRRMQEEVEFEGMSDVGGENASRVSASSDKGSMIFNSTVYFDPRRVSPQV